MEDLMPMECLDDVAPWWCSLASDQTRLESSGLAAVVLFIAVVVHPSPCHLCLAISLPFVSPGGCRLHLAIPLPFCARWFFLGDGGRSGYELETRCVTSESQSSSGLLLAAPVAAVHCH